ncbi:amino acid ABC transporter permease [Paracoccus sp. WLY502]|uniref:amino acid ABC transporter permease n=1 Tax=Paracoccus yibinensis TaxID=3068891 RepID=UPI002796DC86|nr:amino acid ABC transporter permease [Paracoccus sp. WLY502]MDQ1899329.1 amino acid ABC transporter permease [Paracoccus sp. WLY502]
MSALGPPELLFLLRARGWPLALTAIGFVGGIAFGLVMALICVARSRWLRTVAAAGIAIFQGTPLLMQLFIVYFGLPLVGLAPRPGAVAIALTARPVWARSGAAIQAVPLGQSEAAHPPGIGYRSLMRDIILPQALPAAIGFLVQLLNGTSLAAIVGFIELTRVGQIVSNQPFRPLIVFGIVGALYFLLCWPLSLWGSRIERHLVRDRR